MTDAIVFALPEIPDSDRLETHWWLVGDGGVTESGQGSEWVELANSPSREERRRIALAPAASVRIVIGDRPDAASDRQAAAIARVAAVESSLGDPEALHSVSALRGDSVMTAIVDNGVMLAWIDWAQKAGADPHHIVPVGALLPLDDEWTI